MMTGLSDWVMVAVIGLLAGALFWMHTRRERAVPVTRSAYHELRYAWPVKAFVAALHPVTLVLLFSALHATADQRFTALLVAGIFAALTAFLSYQVFCVRFGYDRTFVYFDSPFCRGKAVPWENLEAVGFSQLMQCHYLEFAGIGRVWCSSHLSGYDALGGFLERKSNDLLRPQV